MLSDSERLYILIVQYGLGCFFMLLCARIRGQGARVRLGWCARLISSVPLLLPRRKRSYARFALPAHLISPAARRLF